MSNIILKVHYNDDKGYNVFALFLLYGFVDIEGHFMASFICSNKESIRQKYNRRKSSFTFGIQQMSDSRYKDIVFEIDNYTNEQIELAKVLYA